MNNIIVLVNGLVVPGFMNNIIVLVDGPGRPGLHEQYSMIVRPFHADAAPTPPNLDSATMPPSKLEFFAEPELRQRGWSQAMIQELLGKADKIDRSRADRFTPDRSWPVWDARRVKRIEKTKRFKKALFDEKFDLLNRLERLLEVPRNGSRSEMLAIVDGVDRALFALHCLPQADG